MGQRLGDNDHRGKGVALPVPIRSTGAIGDLLIAPLTTIEGWIGAGAGVMAGEGLYQITKPDEG